MARLVFQWRILTSPLCMNGVASHGECPASGSLSRSYACGLSAPEKRTHPVGGCLWWKCAAGPKKPSLPISRSNVPAGRSACAWRLCVPSARGKRM